MPINATWSPKAWRALALASAAVYIGGSSFAFAQSSTDQASPDIQPTSPGTARNRSVDFSEEIVVTARQRNETLISVPVAVSSIDGDTLDNYGVTDITDLANISPSLILGQSASGGGGAIAIRGVSTSSSNAGFEQAVSVSVDGVQTSRARALVMGLFDVEQIEVMKGPQALFFGKNSPGGVIALRTAGASSTLEGYLQGSYSFVADEKVVEGAISGPLTDNFGARLALRYRNSEGYFRNTAGVITDSPFYGGLQPTLAGRRAGEEELIGRITLEYEPAGSGLNATLKLTGSKVKLEDPTAGVQTYFCGNSNAAVTTSFGLTRTDPYGECKLDRNYQTSSLAPGMADNWPYARQDAYGDYEFYIAGLTVNYEFDDLTLTSVTGYYDTTSDYYGNYDYTSYNFISASEHETYRAPSQELRLLSQFEAPVNFLIGAYYQHINHQFLNSSLVIPVGIDPATGKYHTWEKQSGTKGNTYSVFGQLIWDVTEQVEFSAGVRYTRETKRSFLTNRYLHPAIAGVFLPVGTVLRNNFKDSNYSPEVTLTWRPTAQLTAYLAYKTGFKSGGYGLSGTLTSRNIPASSFAFDSETIKGFEGGVKARLFDQKLSLTTALYSYTYSDLQVSAFDATNVSYSLSNAAGARVKGAELEASYRVVPGVDLRTSVVYNRARYSAFNAACYGGQTFAQGCNVSVSPGPDGISNTGDDVYNQDLSGKPLARAPEWALTAGFNAELPINNDYAIGFSGNTRYSSSFFASENQSPVGITDEYWLFDAAVWATTTDDRWKLSLIGRNLSNRYYVSNASERPGARNTPGTPTEHASIAPQRGREVTLQLTFNY